MYFIYFYSNMSRYIVDYVFLKIYILHSNVSRYIFKCYFHSNTSCYIVYILIVTCPLIGWFPKKIRGHVMTAAV